MERIKRYGATISFYVYAESDIEAIKILEEICKNQREKFDNHASIESLYRHKDGCFDSIPVVENGQKKIRNN